MKILLAASEVAPIIKMGGLGDVVGSLPKALETLGIDVDVIVPYFSFANISDQPVYKNFEITVGYGGETYTVGVFKTKLPHSNVDVILLQNGSYFHKYGKTWQLTNDEETALFSFFDRCVVEYIKSTFNTYDLIHCNDWHTGLITHLLADELGEARPATLFTVHNLMYQGISTPGLVRNVGIVPGEHPLIDWDVADGDLNMMEQGIASADYVNTVSPTYMKEILTHEYGGDLSDILRSREARTSGILNGVDYSSLPREYDTTDFKEKKIELKKQLLSKLNLSSDVSRPLFAFVGRLDPYQKGIDILYKSVTKIVEKGGDFVLLGTGDSNWEEKYKVLSKDVNLSNYISTNILFDTNLAENIYKASDFLIAPSRYEPCGLIQMIAMWYGSLPVVRATGGLKDTVNEGINGFLFDKYDAQELINAIERAFNAFNGQDIDKMIIKAMSYDFSWKKSAESYKELYTKVVQSRGDKT